MGRKSIRENKTIYQLSREKASLTREQAGELMMFVSEDRIEKIEAEKTSARPEEVVTMARCYNDPMLCNQYCSGECPIGRLHVPAVKDKDLPQVTLEIINAVNSLHEERNRLIEIASIEHLPEDALDDLIDISVRLEHLSRSVDSLKLWLRKKMEA